MSNLKVFIISIILVLSGANVMADDIKLFTWESYISSDVIEQFEQEFGHSVTQIYFESEPLRDAIIHTGKGNAYDLVMLDGDTLNRFAKEGILSKVDDVFSNRHEIFPPIALDSCGQYGVPYAHGSMGIGYRTSKVSKVFGSWMDLFDYAKENPGHVVIPNEDIDTVAITLLALGYHPLSENKDELQEAFQLLRSVKGSLLDFRNSDGYANELQEDSVMDVAVIYSGETESIANATGNDDWRYVIPKEGALVWYECLASPINKPMNRATREFIRFINRPEIAAKNAQEIWFATPNKTALSLVDTEYLSDSELFPKNLSETNSYYYRPISSKSLKARSNIVNILSDK